MTADLGRDVFNEKPSKAVPAAKVYASESHLLRLLDLDARTTCWAQEDAAVAASIRPEGSSMVEQNRNPTPLPVHLSSGTRCIPKVSQGSPRREHFWTAESNLAAGGRRTL